MKAHRAIVELGLFGGWYLVTGLVALATATRDGQPGVPAAVALGVLVSCGAVWVIAMAVHRLNKIEGLPEAARRVSWLSVAARVSLSAVLPVGTVVALSATSPAAVWNLALTYAVLGGAICVAAALASHVEHLCGARVWRSRNRFYFAR